MRTIIDDLNTYRLDNRLSQQELAKMLNVAFCTVNRWFRHRHEPNMIQEHHIQKLLEKAPAAFKKRAGNHAKKTGRRGKS
ncbi:MAG TPA: hypothetical protein P5511_09305 [Candidatus Goldiibacteriota bacterium]|nr:hypothetical protein [Candidatus Goldiibacteriota bacterium]